MSCATIFWLRSNAEPRVLAVGLGRLLLRDGRRERRLGLADLVAGLLLLEAQRRLALLHLRAEPLGGVRVVGDVGAQLVRRDDGEQLVALHRVAFVDQQLADLAGDLRADDDVVGGDDAGQHEGGGRGTI